jgi:hypothetical protein
MTTMTTKTAGKFNRGQNNGTATCTICGQTRQRANMERIGADAICTPCYDLAGWENEHEDRGHASEPDMDCPICKADELSGQPDCNVCGEKVDANEAIVVRHATGELMHDWHSAKRLLKARIEAKANVDDGSELPAECIAVGCSRHQGGEINRHRNDRGQYIKVAA